MIVLHHILSFHLVVTDLLLFQVTRYSIYAHINIMAPLRCKFIELYSFCFFNVLMLKDSLSFINFLHHAVGFGRKGFCQSSLFNKSFVGKELVKDVAVFPVVVDVNSHGIVTKIAEGQDAYEGVIKL